MRSWSQYTFTKLNKLFFPPYGNNETFWEIEPTKKAAIQESERLNFNTT